MFPMNPNGFKAADIPRCRNPTRDAICPMTVAQADPAMPMSKAKMKRGSKIVFRGAPTNIQVMEHFRTAIRTDHSRKTCGEY